MKSQFRVLTLALLLSSTNAFAVLQLVPENVNTNSNANLNSQNQGQAQGQLQGQGQGQAQSTIVSNRIDNDVRNNAASFATSSAGAASGSVSQGGSAGSISAINIEVPRMMGAIGLGSLYPTAPCMGTSNFGGGNGFFTFAAGSSWTDDECGIRETSRSFNGMGMKEDALAVLCSSKYAAASAPSCIKAQPKSGE